MNIKIQTAGELLSFLKDLNDQVLENNEGIRNGFNHIHLAELDKQFEILQTNLGLNNDFKPKGLWGEDESPKINR